MKTRNELQKEVNYLKSVIKDIKAGELAASTWHKFYLDKSKKLQSELEVANNHVQHFQNQILEMVKEQKEKEIAIREVEIEREYCRLSIKDIKSLNLFQLIRWWYNAKN